MASTTQSARDYVENARVHLVRELKNLSVIVENLYQQKVFSDEEVSKIQTERDDFEKTRKILDSVTKKGEAACYKFLRIIDMTRKRTVERASVLPEKQSAASTENRKFDLHHWISCYPFKEDTQMDVNYLQGSRPCHRYQAKLKSKAQKISNKFWMANKNLFEGNNPNLSYTALVLDKQGGDSPSKIKKLKSKKRKLSRPKKMKTYIPKDRPGTSPSDLLKTDENILLVGKPGIGKTALSHELLRLWAERDNEELDYMFYFDMRETSHITRAMSLEDLLFSVFSEPDEGREEVLQDIKRNSDNVTIIFDGITDLSSSVVKKLVEKDLLPDAKVIVTCRPDNEEDFGDFLRVEVKGFSEQTIKTYLSAMLGDTQKKVLSNLELLTLCHVPMYALMVAACFSSETPEDSSQPCSITEIYINIVRFCLKMNSNKTKNKDLNSFIENKSEEILSLAEVAFHATEGKTVNLTKLPHKDSCVLCFLKSLDSQGAPTETITTYAFLHYTMQEFFAAIWLLKNPDKIKEVFQQCLTTEKKHMKHLIPFMCRLLTDKSPSLMKCLIPAQELINTSNWFFKEMINRFFPYLCETDEADTEDSGLDVDILFLCQCLFESQCPEACVYFLDKLDYRLDLSGESLGPYPCCAVAYVVTQSKEKKIYLNLEDVMVSEQGMRRLFGCLQNVQWCDPLPRQLWEVFLLSEEQMDYRRLLGLGSNQLHLPVEGKRRLFERAVKVMQKISTQVNVCLHCDRATPACQRLHESLLEALPYISSLSFSHRFRVTGQAEFFGNLFCAAAEREQQTGEKILELLSSVCRYQTFPLKEKWCDFQLDLYSYGCETGLSVLPSLQSVLQSAPAVWSINLSERKTSILLEVLKLQSEKKQVELTGCSHEESEVRSFLQCLPYISQFSFVPQSSDRYEETKFFGNLFCAAAEREQQTGEKILELLSLVCSYKTFPLKEKWWDFLLDLYSYGCETGLSVLPSLQSVLQSAPAVWSINLSERKPSILLEVLKLQSEKKQVKLTGCSHEESEVRSFLQCLPYISQLSFVPQSSDRYEETKFFGNLFCAAAEREQQTGEKILELLSSVCSYKTFPLKEKWWDFLLDLYSYGCETGLSVLPSLQSVLQSAPAVWSINLSERKPSILLEVLKLQSEKKQVKLTGCSHEEIEVRSFLQCLPYISQLSFVPQSSDRYEETKFFGNLFCAAAEREQQTGEKILELLSSVCSYKTFPLKEKWWDFLLDLYSYYCETGLSVLPSLQSVLQSAPAVWSINLSERKPSILLEVLKLQSEKKPVELTGCSYEESEVRSFLQCLPYISQLSVCYWLKGEAKFFGNLFCAAAEREQQTGEKILELLSSVCRYKTFPLNDRYMDYDANKHQCDVLLDLYSHLKDYETKTGLSVLPSLQSVLQSAPAVWFINLSERKTSILLEVLKLQSEKKQVKLTGCSHEESEVRSFLQCLPYISQLSVCYSFEGEAKFFGNLFCAAAEREQQTGEKILELLSSVCRYKTFPLNEEDDDVEEYQCDFLLDLYSHLKDYETKTGLSVLPSLQSVLQSAPAVWFINLSERKPSILLEVLKLQSEKKQVKLTGCSHEETEVRSFLQCLPYISQFSVCYWFEGEAKFFGNLFCAAAEREQQTGEKILELLSSVCRYQTFPLNEWDYDYEEYQRDFLFDLYSHLKDYETKTGLSVLPSLPSVLQSAPAVWSINLSERKPSILLEVLKLQSEKNQVELTGCSHEESEVRSFLQCLPYISQLSVCYWFEGEAKFFGNLFCAAAEREQQTGEKILELLSSVCRYKTFPFNDRNMYYHVEQYQCDFLLDLYSHLKDYETKTGLSVLPSLQSVLQSAPAVWFINLSERKTSILLEVLKLQSEKKQVELTGCSHEESEVRSFLQCLPYISQLSCDPEFFQSVCTLISVRSREDEEQLSSLLQLLGYTLQLTGELHTGTCRSVGRVLRLCGSDVDLILKPRKMSVRGASLLFRHTTQLHSLSLSSDMALLLFQWVRRGRAAGLLAIEELSLTPQTVQPSERVLLKVVSSLASLLRYWSVRQLDLTEFYVPAQGLIPLLLHHGPLTIKLREKISLQLLSLIHEIQDKDLTQLFLSKVGGDLSSCCLNWELLHCLLQQSLDQIITVNLRKNRFLQENVTRLLPFLDKIVVKRPCPRFVLTAIREIYKACASPIIPSLLRSLDHVINLTCREMDSVDCAALLFTLKHSDRVKLNLVFTSIPTGQIESILFTLDKVSQLSVDRNLLLRFIHCCAASDAQQGAAVGLLRALQHRLDLSCSSCVDLPEEGQSETLSLTAEDCRAVSTILRRSSSKDTQLNLQDCELEDSRLDLLFPVLDRVRLRASKALLLQLLSLVPMKTERDTVRRAVSLCRALGGELDLSHTTLDQRACEALAQMLDFSEGLTDLDLSHCELTDQLLFTLITHLHKVQVLDLSHNKITDAAAHMLLQLVSINPSIDTVRLFSNNIVNRNPFKKHQQFEIW
ncbi:uncharacterized protein LOC127378593 isoform X1 [Dicentrarchus labrax]|uniref:uncharacterized protein LOC127378593 isoform X1 n=1 Tax=Dicentrarchus labrax TaxID=13489 RepID=UPI0021F58E72|nr:uncharacterized protein LOC127378593 isoform X1 [Dicentrarchus labrax]XP_051283522.1 uncharacterized protein LOC127378593 isoform X1 [Dicentrarchus labrax]XP_051283523.1 uncharacterized protein LOC127378593 isoform X1 [Dicentrarchus labrax]XP_051283524.1 uncharacterized protein LOC127378593 isoform X1 [Dicentrarchus labrax]XP_051283525.1 uncharacterized protein LOC127378593 isoform X1 [Dicentrarchus labrax]